MSVSIPRRDDIDVHFNEGSGELTLDCGNDSFDALTKQLAIDWVDEFNEPSAVQSIVIFRRCNLPRPTPPGLGKAIIYSGMFGCALAFAAALAIFLVGLTTIVQWMLH
jgi:hypothetical protein